MPALSCYRVFPFDPDTFQLVDVVDAEGPGITASDEYRGADFIAMAFLFNPPPHAVPWADFLRQGFPELVVSRSSSPSALLVVQVDEKPKNDGPLVFAFTFGPSGRFLLRGDSFARGFGLRTALNLIYPRTSGGGARLRAVDSKRRGQTIVRSRLQASSQAEFEVFDVNQLQDVLGKAVGVPADVSWGPRVSGSDALALNVDIGFNELGRFCRGLAKAHTRRDYQERFAWIDHIQPVLDPALVEDLESHVLERLRSKEFDELALAPPEIVDWDQVAAFRYHFNRRRRGGGAVLHPDLRIRDYVAGLERSGSLVDLEADDLRRAFIYAVDRDETDHAKWTVWRCLVGELHINGTTYLLDEGEFFVVSQDYMTDLNEFVAQVPPGSAPLPDTTAATVEAVYNQTAAEGSDELLLLDKQLVRVSDRTSPVEICDLLSQAKQLIHVKRHLGSSDLSHLFAQGVVSAELLQSNAQFRSAASARIASIAAGRPGFDFISEESIVTSRFEVVYAIAARWNGHSVVEALPFFSKVNLRKAVLDLTSRGFRVAVQQICGG